MKSVQLAPDLPLRLDILVETRMLVQATSGGGKSRTLRRLLEQTHGQIQHLVIDPEGEFASLRERFDYVLAAKHGGDTSAEPRAATLLAERLLELGASAVLDLYELKAHERVRFVRLFCEALVEAPKRLWHPVLVVVDEGHVYAPQQTESESLPAVIDLATRGRKRGYCLVLATQRLSKLHKDVAAELKNKLIGNTGLDLDMKRAADELGFGKEAMLALRDLEPGEFWAFGPALVKAPTKVRIGPVQTSHPQTGAKLAAPAPPPTKKIRALLPQLADLPAEAEERARTTEDLKRELADARRKITQLERAAPAAKVEVKTVPVLQGAELGRALKLAERLHSQGERLTTLGKQIAQTALDACEAGGAVASAIERSAAARSAPAPRPAAPPPPRRPAAALISSDGNAPSGLGKRILDGLAWLESVNIERPNRLQVGLVAESAAKGGYFENTLGGLRARGYVAYPGPNLVELTEAGRAVASVPATPPDQEELHERLYARLGGLRAAVLRVLIEVYPDELSREQLGERLNKSSSGGYFENMLGSLRSLGLIDYPRPGVLVASSLVFLHARTGL